MFLAQIVETLRSTTQEKTDSAQLFCPFLITQKNQQRRK
jgi:hypothetical protein